MEIANFIYHYWCIIHNLSLGQIFFFFSSQIIFYYKLCNVYRQIYEMFFQLHILNLTTYIYEMFRWNVLPVFDFLKSCLQSAPLRPYVALMLSGGETIHFGTVKTEFHIMVSELSLALIKLKHLLPFSKYKFILFDK